ncbi:MAG: hypothetical protein QOG69_1235 [Actinomycetota bacterium]|jgi:GGDEF domain-containing protein|nr:hypothetical protein [Actinomycetota bacterium]
MQGQAISGPSAPVRLPHGPFSVARALSGPGRPPDLDPLTGLVDRWWFDHAIGESELQARRAAVETERIAADTPHEAPDFGIIAVGLDDLESINRREGRAAGDGLLLLTAELLQEWSARDDVSARLGGDAFGVLVHADAVHLGRAAASLRSLLERAPIPARLGAAMPGRRGGLAGALRAAEHEVRARRRDSERREGDAARAVGSVRAAIAASTMHAQATGILMQWHGCSAESARLELAYQAHELGLPVPAFARLLIAVASGRTLTEGEDAAGIELERAISLGARVAARASATITDIRIPAAANAPALADGAYGLQSQPAWRLLHPNAATGVFSLRPAVTDVSVPLTDLELAGRYQAAANSRGSGGDWFDAFVLADGTAGVVIGDVAGHDALSATTMMQLRTVLRVLAVGREVAPSEVLLRLDRSLVQFDLGLLATVCFGWVYREDDGNVVLRWSNAGHLPPLVLDSDGETVVLECRDDLLLGLGLGVERADLSVRLPADSTLLLYSDGLIETRTADLDTGIARLCVAARPLARVGVAELCDLLVPAMVGARAPDDVTVLAVRVPPRDGLAGSTGAS